MRYSRVFIERFGYELAPCVVTSAELEERLVPTYDSLNIEPGQLEQITGIRERRYTPTPTAIRAYISGSGTVSFVIALLAIARFLLSNARVPWSPMQRLITYGS